MSAVCGLFRFDGAPVERAALDRLLDALRDFGPEACRWAPETPEAPVALGCRPARVTPEDAFYRPPVCSADGAVALVADARIDNRDELAASLGIAPADARDLPDAGLILAAYQAWGAECVRRLLGDFAFLAWDRRRRSLLGARDGIGHRILFYHLTPQRLAVATTPVSLLALDDVPARLNDLKVAEFLVLLQDPATTFFTGVERLLPGHLLVASADGVRTERFWSPLPTRRIVLASDQEYVDGFLQVFDRAVRAQVRCAGAVGVMLSGGLDSTSVAATAAAQLAAEGRRLSAFHAAPRLGFQGKVRPGWVADESAEVEAIADRYPSIDLRIHRPAGETPFDGVETLFRLAGLPPRNASNQAWCDAIYRAAQQASIRVMLAGHKGNATISYGGVRSLRDQAREGHWRYVLHEVRAVARTTGQPVWQVLKDQVVAPLVPAPLASAYERLRNAGGASILATEYSAIHPDFARATRVDERAREIGVDGFRARRAGEVEYRIMALTAAADAPDLDSSARAQFGIETRAPTSDLRVVEYCLAIPGSQYLRDGRSRWLIRRAMRGRLPDRVLERSTRGAQAADWIEWLPPMRAGLSAELDRLDRSETARRCLDLARLRSLVDRWPERLGPEHATEYEQLLLRGIMMGRFLRWFEATFG